MGLISGLGTWCFWTVVLEKTLESPLDSKEIQPVRPKGNQSWIFIGRTDAEAETPILWPPDSKNWFIWKNPDAGKDWGQEEKGDDRGWDGWMVSLTRWTWVWASSRRWWWTGKPGVLQSMVLQRVGQDWATEMNWTELELAFCMPCSMTKKTEKNCETPFPFPKPCSSIFFSLLTVSYWHLPRDLQNYYSEKERQSFCFPMFVIVKIYYCLFYFSGTVLTSFC